MDFLTNPEFWFTVLRCTTPVLYATTAALIASASGVLNLSLEGAMAISALFGVIGSGYSGSLFVGMVSGMTAGILLTMVLAYCVLHLRANPVITGVALNLAATGGSVFLLYTITGDKNASNSLRSLMFPSLQIPLIEDIPVFGRVLSGHNVLTYFSFITAIVVFVVLKRTRFGIKVRSVGEMPAAAESVGIRVDQVRYQALFLSGLLASIGGIYLSMGYLKRFTSGMVAGRGYIALATNAMAGGNPLLGMLSSGLYGFGNALSIYLQNRNVDVYLINLVPYGFIIVFYAVFSFFQKRKEKQ
ncbi:MAG: ABC transporter permease [Spirochaetaceae bacterium]|jgi:simple sugar transport system permease protein|nr:ABC transporter permease [Spirochaetaceae bacterium]